MDPPQEQLYWESFGSHVGVPKWLVPDLMVPADLILAILVHQNSYGRIPSIVELCGYRRIASRESLNRSRRATSNACGEGVGCRVTGVGCRVQGVWCGV